MKIFVATICAVFFSVGIALADTTMLFESFEQDADNPAEVADFYPAWEFIPQNVYDQANVRVVDGVLRLQGSWNQPTRFALTDSPQGAFSFSADVGTEPGHYCVNVGVEVGQNEIVFHPGYPGTALRVEGPGGFSNRNLGFTLAPATLHQFTLAHDGEGLFEITLTDAYNAENTTTMQFWNPGSIGGTISLTRASCIGSVSEGLFDNIEITIPGGIDLAIDVKPGSDRNPINLGAKGVLPVAILTTENFDAAVAEISWIGLSDTELTGSCTPQKSSVEDIDGDGLEDLMLHFSQTDLVANDCIDDTTSELTLHLETFDGEQGSGSNAVSILTKTRRR